MPFTRHDQPRIWLAVSALLLNLSVLIGALIIKRAIDNQTAQAVASLTTKESIVDMAIVIVGTTNLEIATSFAEEIKANGLPVVGFDKGKDQYSLAIEFKDTSLLLAAVSAAQLKTGAKSYIME